MRLLILSLLLISCGKSDIDINAPEEMPTVEVKTDIPDEINVKSGLDFQSIYDWCEGKINHEIDDCFRANLGNVCYDLEADKDFLINECYYSFDLSTVQGN